MSASFLPHQQALPSLTDSGPASSRVVVAFGFWLFLLSDIVVFASLFAAYAVLSHRTAGGPTGAELFERRSAFIETLLLLASSFTCGLAAITAQRRAKTLLFLLSGFTILLGISFLALEASEFASLLARGAAPSRSAFLSAFYALVGAHGLHVGIGLLWLSVMLAQVATLGFTPPVTRRLLCFTLFWHALDLVWIGVFTIVYLGAP